MADPKSPGAKPKKRQALGRGLGALIPQDDPEEAPALRELPIDRIDPGEAQPREHFDPRSLEELAASIRRYGILQPLVVAPEGDRFHLIAGERRLRAARLAELTTVPAVIRVAARDEQFELALIENVQRADLNPVEEARGYLQLMDTFGMTQQQVAGRIGKSRSYIANKARLLQLPEDVQLLLTQGELSEGHARALLSLDDPARMLEAAREVTEGSLSVRDTEQLARRRASRPRRQPRLDPDWEAVRQAFEDATGTPVSLQRSKRGGRLTIRFYSNDQLEELLQRLRR